MNVTITQQNGFFYLIIGKYVYQIFSCAERAEEVKRKVEHILAK